jgi:hypothetical protein
MHTDRETCDHPGCGCALDKCSVTHGDRTFCSGDCADGTGCEHADCKCGRTRRPPPNFAAFIQGAVRHLHK